MLPIVTAARAALFHRNWYAALTVALTLPDIASGLETDDGRTSGRSYGAWFDRWLPIYSQPEERAGRIRAPFLTGADCSALRCAFLHNGIDDIEQQRARETLKRFIFLAPNAGRSFHLMRFEKIFLQLDVSRFVEDICVAVENWRPDFFRQRSEKAAAREANLIVIYDSSTVRSMSVDADGTFHIEAKPV